METTILRKYGQSGICLNLFSSIRETLRMIRMNCNCGRGFYLGFSPSFLLGGSSSFRINDKEERYRSRFVPRARKPARRLTRGVLHRNWMIRVQKFRRCYRKTESSRLLYPALSFSPMDFNVRLETWRFSLKRMKRHLILQRVCFTAIFFQKFLIIDNEKLSIF